LKGEPFVGLALEQRERGKVRDIVGDDLFRDSISRHRHGREASRPFGNRSLARFAVDVERRAVGSARIDADADVDRFLRAQRNGGRQSRVVDPPVALVVIWIVDRYRSRS
jgi:hypothetical protein